ncbi:hypothetical protein N8I77_009000 [Diaporthe amygdali]|uniref:Uncharacterized protein n=1 Tax=Phomopsis amygdali TaxID=1214568 RepID=A0AAD9S8Q8_PHOAM|nr:hypothetical protein N8I77_009000 [Diaporthe amygdali]
MSRLDLSCELKAPLSSTGPHQRPQQPFPVVFAPDDLFSKLDVQLVGSLASTNRTTREPMPGRIGPTKRNVAIGPSPEPSSSIFGSITKKNKGVGVAWLAMEDFGRWRLICNTDPDMAPPDD